MQITVDIEKCCGAGQCVLAAPDVFDQDDTGVVVLLDPTPPTSQRTAILEAATLCPAGAIKVGA
ncbi:ferredoxin [Plantactinospora endophytica]|uniref:Ferredoxin n=1 Tax=Plantactinospora endophytica TaxID=673535 RepID=A0ABQ4EEV2_9ACTN|nr:ferredoxin [Plantactinospora endophytica]GIG93243.1 ferredoxin [Plantactinospora endophytica]